MEFITLISTGIMTQFLNFIELWLLIKKSERKSPFEIILLSLAFADFLTGTGALFLGTADSLYLFMIADIITVLGIAASFIHVLLIAIERFVAVYFPIHHSVFVFKRQTSLITITLGWIVSVTSVLVYTFQFKAYLIFALILVLVLTGLLVVIYGLIMRKIVLNNRQQIFPGESQARGRRNKIQRLVVINSGIIAACSIFCSSPWVILTILRLLKGVNIERFQIGYRFTHHTMVLNSLFDPLIYFLVSYYRRRKGI